MKEATSNSYRERMVIGQDEWLFTRVNGWWGKTILTEGEEPRHMVLGVYSINITQWIQRTIKIAGWDPGTEDWVSSLELREKTSIATCQSNPSGGSRKKGLLNSTYSLLTDIFSVGHDVSHTHCQTSHLQGEWKVCYWLKITKIHRVSSEAHGHLPLEVG